MSARDQLTTTTDQGSVLWTLEEIGRLVSHSGNPAETLNNLVHLIKRRFGTDVCSVYLLEPDRVNLVLAATIGLRPEGVGRIRMSCWWLPRRNWIRPSSPLSYSSFTNKYSRL